MHAIYELHLFAHHYRYKMEKNIAVMNKSCPRTSSHSSMIIFVTENRQFTAHRHNIGHTAPKKRKIVIGLLFYIFVFFWIFETLPLHFSHGVYVSFQDPKYIVFIESLSIHNWSSPKCIIVACKTSRKLSEW